MIEKKTEIDQIEVTQSGIQVRLALIIAEGEQELDRKYHRTAVDNGGDVEAQFELVNQHLESMGRDGLSASDIQRIKTIANAAWGA